MSATRRLAAILTADVAGYSRLIGADEEGTLNRLRSIRCDVTDPRISQKQCQQPRQFTGRIALGGGGANRADLI